MTLISVAHAKNLSTNLTGDTENEIKLTITSIVAFFGRRAVWERARAERERGAADLWAFDALSRRAAHLLVSTRQTARCVV